MVLFFDKENRIIHGTLICCLSAWILDGYANYAHTDDDWSCNTNGGALVSTGLLISGKRVEDSRWPP